MALPRYDKHPLATKDYPCDWQAPAGVTISGVVSSVSPAGPTVAGSGSALRSITRMSGGTAATLYQIQEVVTFSDGQIDVSEFEVYVIDL